MEENCVNVPFLKHGEKSDTKVQKSGIDAMSVPISQDKDNPDDKEADD